MAKNGIQLGNKQMMNDIISSIGRVYGYTWDEIKQVRVILTTHDDKTETQSLKSWLLRFVDDASNNKLRYINDTFTSGLHTPIEDKSMSNWDEFRILIKTPRMVGIDWSNDEQKCMKEIQYTQYANIYVSDFNLYAAINSMFGCIRKHYMLSLNKEFIKEES